jgi:hypothetical protein
MQLSIKPPPEFTVPILEKCTAFKTMNPSAFAMDCVIYCLHWMNDHPHRKRKVAYGIVEKYYYALGREHELSSFPVEKESPFVRQLAEQDRQQRFKEANRRLEALRVQFQRQIPAKHLHIKISGGFRDLPTLIKDKCIWLRMTPNAFVVACLRDCLAIMNDSRKALESPAIAVDFWIISHVKEKHKTKNVYETMAMSSIKEILMSRSGPILDTIVRHAISEEWDVPLKKILLEADSLTEEGGFKP